VCKTDNSERPTWLLENVGLLWTSQVTLALRGVVVVLEHSASSEALAEQGVAEKVEAHWAKHSEAGPSTSKKVNRPDGTVSTAAPSRKTKTKVSGELLGCSTTHKHSLVQEPFSEHHVKPKGDPGSSSTVRYAGKVAWCMHEIFETDSSDI